MALELLFLGTGSAFTVSTNNYQSNMLLRLNGKSLLFDAGSDVRRALCEQGLSYKDINHIYISHLHSDHIGGLEWLALTSHFDPSTVKPELYLSHSLVHDLWEHCISGGLRTIQSQITTLDYFFNVHSIAKNRGFDWQGIYFTLVQTVHVVSGYELMPCYGLIFEYQGKKIFITSDSQYCPNQLHYAYEEADVIYHDCETTSFNSGVHANYAELRTIPDKYKRKMWLYHYNDGDLPDAEKDGFLGFVKKGQVFKF